MTNVNFLQHILVVEDQHLMRLALVQELQAAIPASIVHAAPTMEAAAELIHTMSFSLIFIDPGLPGYDPKSDKDRLRIVTMLMEQSAAAIHIIVTGSDSRDEWERFSKLGVAGYIAKNNLKPGTMSAILEEIAEHGTSVGLIHEASAKPEVYHTALSRREQEVLAWMRQKPASIRRKEIYEQLGEQMNIDPASAERYYKRAKAKLLKFGPLPDLL